MFDQTLGNADRLGAHAIPAVDCADAAQRIQDFLKTTVRKLNRRGCVLGVSGGVDSAVCVTLAVQALGPERVLALLMPERDIADDGEMRARRLCESLGIRFVIEEISAPLDALGCYLRRDAAIRTLFPEYGIGWRQKIAVAGGGGWTSHFNLIVQTPKGQVLERRMPAEVYLQVVAATNFKQRIRKNLEYFYAESHNYAVLGTPNRLEYQLGFFVRGGDGLADLKPIAHLYKTQVYQLAEYLGVPEEICSQPPSTDTYSLPQTQEEFYFALPYGEADQVLYGISRSIGVEAIAKSLGRPLTQVVHVVRDFERKRQAAQRTLRDAYLLEEHP